MIMDRVYESENFLGTSYPRKCEFNEKQPKEHELYESGLRLTNDDLSKEVKLTP